MKNKKLNEGIAEFADAVDKDHEIEMAKADLYKIAEYSIKLHEILKSVSEERGIEAWQQAKITKAADYIGSVYHSLNYDVSTGVGSPAKNKMRPSMGESEKNHYKSILEKKLTKIEKKK